MFTRRWLRAGVALIALALGLPSAGLACHADAAALAGAAASVDGVDLPPCHGHDADAQPVATLIADTADIGDIGDIGDTEDSADTADIASSGTTGAEMTSAEQADGAQGGDRTACPHCAACHAAQAPMAAVLMSWPQTGPDARPAGPGETAPVAFITAGPERPPRG